MSLLTRLARFGTIQAASTANTREMTRSHTIRRVTVDRNVNVGSSHTGSASFTTSASAATESHTRPYPKSPSVAAASSPSSSSAPNIASSVASIGSIRARRSSPSPASSGLPSLKHFVLRQQVLTMYRRMVRLCRRIEDPIQRAESIEHAASEIRAMRHATETSHIKALLQEGKRKIDTFETMLNLTK